MVKELHVSYFSYLFSFLDGNPTYFYPCLQAGPYFCTVLGLPENT